MQVSHFGKQKSSLNLSQTVVISRCNSGWTGSNCLTCIPKSGCGEYLSISQIRQERRIWFLVNGHCIDANQCICNSHWLGSLCDKRTHAKIDLQFELISGFSTQMEMDARIRRV